MYTVKLIDRNRQRDIFCCETLEEANACAQYYMRHRTEYNSIVYILPACCSNRYDEDMAKECVNKCRIEDEKESRWILTDYGEEVRELKANLQETINQLTKFINN